jgi:hypothetical protein
MLVRFVSGQERFSGRPRQGVVTWVWNRMVSAGWKNRLNYFFLPATSISPFPQPNEQAWSHPEDVMRDMYNLLPIRRRTH